MTDLWLIYGQLIVDPKFPGEIDDWQPAFTPYEKGAFVYLPKGETQERQITKEGVGRLEEGSTTSVRKNLTKYLRSQYKESTPVISLYAAGSVCRLWKTNDDKWRKSFEQVRPGLPKDVTSFSLELVTLMGACFVDPKLTQRLLTPDWLIADEFGISRESCEGIALQNWMRQKDFDKWQAIFRDALSWRPGTAEVMIWYEKFENAAN